MNIINNGLGTVTNINELTEMYNNNIRNINNGKYMSKLGYDKSMDILEHKIENVIVPITDCIHKTDEIIDNLDKLKQTLLTNKEKLQQVEPLQIELGKAINNKYLESGSKMSKLALASLPQSDEELDNTITASLNKLNLSEDEKSNAHDFYMNAVNTERKLGGKKRKTNRRKTNRRRTIKNKK